MEEEGEEELVHEEKVNGIMTKWDYLITNVNWKAALFQHPRTMLRTK